MTQFDALVTAAESTAEPHRYAHALTRRANQGGLSTFTFQHGLENLGLTSKVEGDHEFASRTILTWTQPESLPTWVPKSRRDRCVGVGRITCAPRGVTQFPAWRDDGKIVAVFENLHWERYDETYVRSFLSDLDTLVRMRPDLRFLVKPHPAGRWLSRNPDAINRAAANLMIADPVDASWARVSAAAVIERAKAVVTTPSTVALDAACAGRPVAVAAYGLDLPAYEPLPLLAGAPDWGKFIAVAIDKPAVFKPRLETFVARNLIPGDAARRIVTAIEGGVRASKAGAR
ncbi:MAG: hypothetical protein ACREUQ_03495 [Burkholderiales bacterium]